MTDIIITAALAALLGVAWWRRRDAVVGWLAGTFALATALGQWVTLSYLPGVIGLTDGLVGLAMLWVVTNCLQGGECDWCERSQRARFVGWIAAGKVALSLGYAGTFGYSLDWVWYAGLINGGFAMQVAVAGGWLNGLGVFLDGMHRRFRRQPVGAAHHRTGA